MGSHYGPPLKQASNLQVQRAGAGCHVDTEPLARLTVSLPRSLYRQVRLHALDEDTTLSALLISLIRDELS